jgi:protein-S-isoprenylcysteine O-methyltransferase Ste14
MKTTFSGILNLVAVVLVFYISYLTKLGFSLPENLNRKILGLIIVYLGMAIVVWAVWHLRKGIFGGIEPEKNHLVKTGPYKHIRHPVYLGMTIAMLGIPIFFVSWMGLLAVLIIFLPTEIYRAILEEKLLASKFGKEWDEYKGKSGFLFPPLHYRRQYK